MREVVIKAFGEHAMSITEPLPDLRPLVKEASGRLPPRGGRFIQLALLGACRCVGARQLSPDTAVYFTTGCGDFETNICVMEDMIMRNAPPRPISFVNSVSNAACFHVAKHFGLSGPSNCIAGRHFSYETALQLAITDIQSGAVQTALVGSADIALAPLDVHRRRLNQPADAQLGEGAHWLLLGASTAAQKGPSVEFFPNLAVLAAWLGAHNADPDEILFARGHGLGEAGALALMAQTGLTRALDYRCAGYYECQSGAAIGAFLRHGDRAAKVLLHVDAAPDGRCAAMMIAR